jgi:hypothetical protein
VGTRLLPSSCKGRLNCFCLEVLILIWAHELTKHGRKAWCLCLHFAPVVSCSHLGIKEGGK